MVVELRQQLRHVAVRKIGLILFNIGVDVRFRHQLLAKVVGTLSIHLWIPLYICKNSPFNFIRFSEKYNMRAA